MLASTDSNGRVYAPIRADWLWFAEQAEIRVSVCRPTEHPVEMKRLLFVLLSILILLSLWVLLILLGFPLIPCFLWPDFVIYCSEGRLYMS